MRAARAVLPLVAFVVACGPRATEPDPGRTAEAARARRAEPRRPASASPAGDPCAPLRARLVRHDTAGQPFAFSFERPDGFTVKDFSQGETVGADLTLDLDGKGETSTSSGSRTTGGSSRIRRASWRSGGSSR